MLVQLVKERNLFLISDEVYREFIFTSAKHTSLLEFMEEIPQQTIMLDSLSKRYSLCGGRLGIFVSLNMELMKGVTKIAQSRLSAGLVDQLIAAKLSKVPKSYIKKVQAEYRSRRDFIYKGLKKIPGVDVCIPEGAFYLMAGLPVKNAEQFCIWLLEKYRTSEKETLMLAPGEGFYASPGKGKNEVRIAYVLNKKDLQKSLYILESALEEFKSLRPRL
jgi:aspartate aminotransferase